jgi:hypothetical protein
LFIRNRETDDKTLILPRDALGVLWWQVQQARQKQPVQKANFTVRLLSGPRERNLDFRIIEVKPDLFLIAPIEKLAPGNRYEFTHQKDTQQPASAERVEAIVENTAFSAIKNQVQLWYSSSERASLRLHQTGACAAGLRMSLPRTFVSRSQPPLTGGASPYCLKRFLTASATGSHGLTYAETILPDRAGGAMEAT